MGAIHYEGRASISFDRAPSCRAATANNDSARGVARAVAQGRVLTSGAIDDLDTGKVEWTSK